MVVGLVLYVEGEEQGDSFFLPLHSASQSHAVCSLDHSYQTDVSLPLSLDVLLLDPSELE